MFHVLLCIGYGWSDGWLFSFRILRTEGEEGRDIFSSRGCDEPEDEDEDEGGSESDEDTRWY